MNNVFFSVLTQNMTLAVVGHHLQARMKQRMVCLM